MIVILIWLNAFVMSRHIFFNNQKNDRFFQSVLENGWQNILEDCSVWGSVCCEADGAEEVLDQAIEFKADLEFFKQRISCN